jgi:hypothetical protein
LRIGVDHQCHPIPAVIQEPTLAEWGVTKMLGTMAGIYVMVRGLDNMDVNLPAT